MKDYLHKLSIARAKNDTKFKLNVKYFAPNAKT